MSNPNLMPAFLLRAIRLVLGKMFFNLACSSVNLYARYFRRMFKSTGFLFNLTFILFKSTSFSTCLLKSKLHGTNSHELPEDFTEMTIIIEAGCIGDSLDRMIGMDE
jgi:hypothetical protein